MRFLGTGSVKKSVLMELMYQRFGFINSESMNIIRYMSDNNMSENCRFFADIDIKETV